MFARRRAGTFCCALHFEPANLSNHVQSTPRLPRQSTKGQRKDLRYVCGGSKLPYNYSVVS